MDNWKRNLPNCQDFEPNKNDWAGYFLVVAAIVFCLCYKCFAVKNPNYGVSDYKISNQALLTSAKISDWDKYRNGIKSIAITHGLSYDKLMWISYFESNHGAKQLLKDSNGRLVKGVWQWTPSNRKEFSIPENVHLMKPCDQLAYIERYIAAQIKFFGKPKNTYTDYYLMNFLPVMMNRKNDYVAEHKFLKNNPTLDIDNDGLLTRKDIDSFVNKKIKSLTKAKGI